jgi:DNA modification methylase
MAGEVTGRRVFAMAISPVYVDVAVLRWQQATGQPAVLENDGRTYDHLAAERLPAAA